PSLRVESPIAGSIWKVGEPVPMVGNVTDLEGDPTTAYWDFDKLTDSTGTGNATQNRDANGTTASHIYTVPGYYNITFWATDGDRTVNQSRTVIIQSFNLPPVLLSGHVTRLNGTAAGNNTFRINETVVVTAMVYDPENDTLNTSIDWGDGVRANQTIDLKTALNCTLDNLGGKIRKVCPVSFSHIYASIGSAGSKNYTVLVTTTDNQVFMNYNFTTGKWETQNHTAQLPLVVFITDLHTVGPTPWTWWDYSTLSLVLGIP